MAASKAGDWWSTEGSRALAPHIQTFNSLLIKLLLQTLGHYAEKELTNKQPKN
jgi:hypothetical protein